MLCGPAALVGLLANIARMASWAMVEDVLGKNESDFAAGAFALVCGDVCAPGAAAEYVLLLLWWWLG